MTALLVALGAAAGAPARYLIDRAVQARHGSAFPWGTLTVNVGGSMLLGLLAGATASRGVTALLGTGFCGALTTYSTFGYELLRLTEEGAARHAVLYAAASVAAGLGAGYAGILLGQELLG